MVLRAVAELIGIYWGGHVFWSMIFVIVSASIVFLGVQKGIDNFSKFVIPLLILMLIFVVIHTLSSPATRSEFASLMKPKREDFNIRCATFCLQRRCQLLRRFGIHAMRDAHLAALIAQLLHARDQSRDGSLAAAALVQRL